MAKVPGPEITMLARYDQDLTPFFERIRELDRARLAERRSALRQSWVAVLSLLGRRQKV